MCESHSKSGIPSLRDATRTVGYANAPTDEFSRRGDRADKSYEN
ncbi:MAG: hypothetical protein V7K30_12845 [Nostoc sp.]